MKRLPKPTASIVVASHATDDVRRLIDAWLRRQAETTRLAYGRDLEKIATWSGFDDVNIFVRELFSRGPLAAATMVSRYLDEARRVRDAQPLSTATRNRRRAAISSLVRLGRGLGVITWELHVPGVKSQAYRDVRGPDVAAVQSLLAAACKQQIVKALRDAALVWLLWCLALRRAEICSLDIMHFDRDGHRIYVLGKGRSEREWLTVPEIVAAAIDAYLDARGRPAFGPLFANVDRAQKGERLSPSGVYVIIRKLGEAAGVRGIVSPHRLRHSAVTSALDLTDGDVRRVQRLSRHSKLETVAHYDDRRRDPAAEVAGMLANALVATNAQNIENTAEVHENAHSREHISSSAATSENYNGEPTSDL